MKDPRKALKKDLERMQADVNRKEDGIARLQEYQSHLDELESLEKGLYKDGLIKEPCVYMPPKKAEGAAPPASKVPLGKSYSFDDVVATADKLMETGRAVSVDMLAEALDYRGAKSKELVRDVLNKCEPRFKRRELWMYAWPDNKFAVYQPGSKRLPFVPPSLTVEQYDKLVLTALSLALPDEFDRKEFYRLLSVSVGMTKKELMCAVPSILDDLEHTGRIEHLGDRRYRCKDAKQ